MTTPSWKKILGHDHVILPNYNRTSFVSVTTTSKLTTAISKNRVWVHNLTLLVYHHNQDYRTVGTSFFRVYPCKEEERGNFKQFYGILTVNYDLTINDYIWSFLDYSSLKFNLNLPVVLLVNSAIVCPPYYWQWIVNLSITLMWLQQQKITKSVIERTAFGLEIGSNWVCILFLDG